MNDDVKELKQDVKEIKASVCRIEVSTEKNSVVLDQHIMRTALNEKRIMQLEYWALAILTSALGTLIIKTFF